MQYRRLGRAGLKLSELSFKFYFGLVNVWPSHVNVDNGFKKSK